MKNNFKGGMSSNLTAFDVAKKWKISPIEFMPILEKGTEHEMEHTDDKDIARRIALDHIVERLDYYDMLDKIEKMSKGGGTDINFNDKALLKKYNDGESIGFTAIAHLKSKGLKSTTLLALGYRDPDKHWLVNLKKVRRSKEAFVTEIK